MKVILLIAGLLLSAVGDESTNVYICLSVNAEVYHYNRNCQGLKRCTHEVKTVTKTEAINKYKRRLCGYED